MVARLRTVDRTTPVDRRFRLLVSHYRPPDGRVVPVSRSTRTRTAAATHRATARGQRAGSRGCRSSARIDGIDPGIGLGGRVEDRTEVVDVEWLAGEPAGEHALKTAVDRERGRDAGRSPRSRYRSARTPGWSARRTARRSPRRRRPTPPVLTVTSSTGAWSSAWARRAMSSRWDSLAPGGGNSDRT